MEVHNPKLLPRELISLADYYGLKRLVALHRGERYVLGKAGDSQAFLYPDKIFRHAGNLGSSLKAAVWILSLETLLHEIAHTMWHHESAWVRNAQIVRKSEAEACCFARKELLRLADLDDDLFMPYQFRDWGYLGVRIGQALQSHAEHIRQTESIGDCISSLFTIWAAKLNAGNHVRWADPWARHCTRIHYTSDGRRWRFLTVAQMARAHVWERTSTS